MKCFLTNFSHDLALSHNGACYTPPPNVRIMERDLAALADYFTPTGEVSYNPYAPVWGWDSTLVGKLKTCGFSNLPSSEQLEMIRRLSSRETAVNVLGLLTTSLPRSFPLCGESTVCYSKDALCLLGKRIVWKELWSGSGRGLRFVNGVPTVQQLNWALRCMERQGGLVVEPFYNKIQDFALEFIVTETAVEFCGLSVFHTTAGNAYAGNILMPQQQLWKMMEVFFSYDLYRELISALVTVLVDVFLGRYVGPLGVDMMVINDCGELAVHPCVEINVRRTMGMLSLRLSELVCERRKAEFRLVYCKNSEELAAMCGGMPKPVFNVAGKLTDGVMRLTPLRADTHFLAIIEIVA